MTATATTHDAAFLRFALLRYPASTEQTALFAGCNHLLLIGMLWGTGLGALGGWGGALIARRAASQVA
jgi:hypothetical protein